MPKRTDSNHAAVIAALRQCGATVHSLHREGRGCPDLLVGFQGENYLFEVKASEKDRLTPDEQRWHQDWRGRVATVYSPAHAVTTFLEMAACAWP